MSEANEALTRPSTSEEFGFGAATALQMIHEPLDSRNDLLIRNQQVVRSIRIAGSKFINKIIDPASSVIRFALAG